MKIGLRILLGYFLIVGLAAWFLLNVFMEEVKPGVRDTLEDTLGDSAQLLAGMAAASWNGGALEPALARQLRASPHRITITDARGIVRFDSQGRDEGKDYSRWNDVYLTLRGKYGARMTRDDPQRDDSVVMYVAAPVREPGYDGSQSGSQVGNQAGQHVGKDAGYAGYLGKADKAGNADAAGIIGVLTVAKPISSVQAFVERSQRKMLGWGGLLLGLSLLIGVAISWRLVQRVSSLMRFVEDVQAGRKAVMPRLGGSEISTLGRAIDAMREKLEGREYVETLMHTLTHELKSPIAAIQASAELLEEDMPPQERRRFLANIQAQNQRQRQLIDRLLALVRVEKQQRLDAAEPVDVAALLQDVADDYRAPLAERSQLLDVSVADQLQLRGDPLLLRQALGNLLDNAISFAPAHSTLRLEAGRSGDQVAISMIDGGPGVPDYAAQRIFERFYSLPRPDGAKSTGLGLPFVREVAALHGGSVEVVNAVPGQGGCRATLRLPFPLAL